MQHLVYPTKLFSGLGSVLRRQVMRGSTVMGTNDCVKPFNILSTSHIWHCMEDQCMVAQVLFTMYLDIAENFKML